MVPWFTYSRSCTLMASTRILARIIDASFINWTFIVCETFSSLAADQSIANIPLGTSTHWPFLSSVIVSWGTLCVGTARIRLAKILCKNLFSFYHLFLPFIVILVILYLLQTWNETPAGYKWITSHVSRATADRSSTTQFTVGVYTTGTFTRVYTFWIKANWFTTRTVCIVCAFCLTWDVRISLPVLKPVFYHFKEYFQMFKKKFQCP